jgi:nucleotide-binding universal stress UspA family protein
VDEGPHSRLAADLAPALATWCDADVRPLTFVPGPATEEQARALKKAAEKVLEGTGVESRLSMVRADDVAGGLVRHSDAGDLVLTGGWTAGALAQLIAPPVPLELIERSGVPVVVVRSYERERAGWLQRALALR